MPLPWPKTFAILAYAVVSCLVVNGAVEVVIINCCVPTANRALQFFGNDFWRGPKPQPNTILKVSPSGSDARYRVRASRVMERRKTQAR
jgi:hypothetical protein